MGKRVAVLVADGSEELEAIAVIDILRRAGLEVDIVSTGDMSLILSKGIKIFAEKSLKDVQNLTYDAVVLPGGMPGAENLRNSRDVIDFIKKHLFEGFVVAAICASPVLVLDHHGLTKGRRITCHPSFSHLIKDGTHVDEPVIVDGNLITAKGAGYSVEFALKILEILSPEENVKEVKKGLTLI